MKHQTKPDPNWSRSRRKAHNAALRKRETWMPTLQAAHVNLAKVRQRSAKQAPLHIKQPQPAEREKPKVALLGNPGYAMGGLFRAIRGVFRKRAVTV